MFFWNNYFLFGQYFIWRILTVVLLGLFLSSCAQLKDNAFSSEELYLLDKYHPEKVVNEDNSKDVVATFYGTSSILFADSREAILIDGFFSRPEFPGFLFSRLEQTNVSAFSVTLDYSLPSVSVSNGKSSLRKVVVLHSHYDHVMDAPCIANAYGSTLIGSQSTLNIKCNDTLAVSGELASNFASSSSKSKENSDDSFYLTMLDSKHGSYGSSLANWALGIGEDIKQPLKMPAYITQLCEGQSYSVLLDHNASNLRILVHGSAGYIPGVIASSVGSKRVDWLFLSIGGLARADIDEPGFAQQYLKETIDASGARYVVPIHWDDFTRPVTKTLYPPRKRFGNFLEEMKLVEKHINSKAKAERPKLVLLNYKQQVAMSKENRF